MSNLSGKKKSIKLTAACAAKNSPSKAEAGQSSEKSSTRTAVKARSKTGAKSQSSVATAQTDPSNKAKRWSFIQNDLENALNTWDDLEKNQVSLSPEEEQLEKIKTIIGQLKDKLNQF